MSAWAFLSFLLVFSYVTETLSATIWAAVHLVSWNRKVCYQCKDLFITSEPSATPLSCPEWSYTHGTPGKGIRPIGCTCCRIRKCTGMATGCLDAQHKQYELRIELVRKWDFLPPSQNVDSEKEMNFLAKFSVENFDFLSRNPNYQNPSPPPPFFSWKCFVSFWLSCGKVFDLKVFFMRNQKYVMEVPPPPPQNTHFPGYLLAVL